MYVFCLGKCICSLGQCIRSLGQCMYVFCLGKCICCFRAMYVCVLFREMYLFFRAMYVFLDDDEQYLISGSTFTKRRFSEGS